MSTTVTALRTRPARPSRPVARGRPARPVPAARPVLRVVDGAAARRSAGARRLLAPAVASLVCACIVAVGFHVVVAQSQIEIEGLRRRVGIEQQRYERLRLEVAEKASPERVVERATAAGMVPATEPATAVAAPASPETSATPAADSTATTLAEGWEKVKRHLATQP